jgi:hypothetical protein
VRPKIGFDLPLKGFHLIVQRAQHGGQGTAQAA